MGCYGNDKFDEQGLGKARFKRRTWTEPNAN